MTLLRLLDPSTGQILIDDLDISHLAPHDLRSRITSITQAGVFLPGTIRTNMDPRNLHSTTAILSALDAVTLLDLIEAKTHPDAGAGGLDADLADLHLSHGQKQLFCLARALLNPGRIVVLDEATSTVDEATDRVMQRVIRESFGGQTILSVAHRLEGILDYDRVVVLDGGEVVEEGDPFELLEGGEETWFGRLWRAVQAEEGEEVGGAETA